MSDLPKCSLCKSLSDPRWGMSLADGICYPLCDACAPFPGDKQDIAAVAKLLRGLRPKTGEERATRVERERVVAYLRRCRTEASMMYAKAIDRGEHLPEEERDPW